MNCGRAESEISACLQLKKQGPLLEGHINLFCKQMYLQGAKVPTEPKQNPFQSTLPPTIFWWGDRKPSAILKCDTKQGSQIRLNETCEK